MGRVQWFIRKRIGFCIRSVYRFRGRFVVFISILHEGREWAHPTGINPLDIFLPCVPFLFSFSLTTRATVWEALGHLDSLGVEVHLRVVLVKPGETEDHALLSEVGDC